MPMPGAAILHLAHHEEVNFTAAHTLQGMGGLSHSKIYSELTLCGAHDKCGNLAPKFQPVSS